MSKPDRISPLALLVPPEFVTFLGAQPDLSAIERRVLVYLYADALRGRGRISNALRNEAATLRQAGALAMRPFPESGSGNRVWRKAIRVIGESEFRRRVNGSGLR